jgi:hypothetical protein
MAVERVRIGKQDLCTAREKPASILALEAQYYEQQLIWPIFQMALQEATKKTPAFSIALYMFDGVIIQAASNRNVQDVSKN